MPLTILGLPPTPEIQLMLNEVQALVHSGVDAGVARDDATIEKLRALGYVE